MTSRERQASGGVTLAARPVPTLPRAGSAAAASDPCFPLWEDLYRSASPNQQTELLALAARQGLLYAHQLPPLDPSALLQRRQFLPNLLAGKLDLTPAAVDPVAVADAALDAAQREAVARALSTPDLCLIQGPPGSGKSRVLAELVTRAAARGERVLLLAADAAAIDRVLELAGHREALCPIRCLARGEGVQDLPDSIRPFAFDERVRSLRETTTQAVQADLLSAQQRFEQLRGAQATWEQFEKLASCQELLEGKLANLAGRRGRLAEDIEHVLAAARDASAVDAPSSFAVEVLACRRAHEQGLERIAAECKALQTQRAESGGRRQSLQQESDALKPVAEAWRRSRWWSPAWWRALFQKGLLGRHDELSGLLQTLDREDASRAAQAARLEMEREQCATTFAERQKQLLDAERARREQELEREEAELRQEASLIRRQWDESEANLGELAGKPQGLTPQAVARARAVWQAQRDEAASRYEFIRKWAECLAEMAATLPARLVTFANLVAATTDGLASDAHFGDTAVAPPAFDLLILEEAHQVTESEFLNAARRARRWVLVGEPAAPSPTVPKGPGRAPRPPLRSGFFQRLWHQVHAAPARLPFAWGRAEGKLCCRLRPVPVEQQRWVEKEPVVDCPEIELLILAAPQAEPVLVEVRFPPAMPIRQAKEYIYKELQEIPAHCRGHSLRWQEGAAGIRLHLGLSAEGEEADAAPPEAVVVSLEDGVREIVRPVSGAGAFETLGFEFDGACGWTRPRAEEWAKKRLNLRDLGRTVYLARPHRMRGRLGDALSVILSPEEMVACVRRSACPEEDFPGVWNGWSAPVEVIAVPPAAPRAEPRKRGPEGRRGGAGFELDLSDSTHSEHLPAPLRSLLPRRGLVNYFEAQAVVAALEALVTDSVFRADVAAWQSQHPENGPALVATALYTAQVQLLQLLVGQSRPLAQAGLNRVAEGCFRVEGDRPFAVWIDVPAALRQRECLTLLLGLTRSHTHRAVALGDDPSWLPLALTRASGRLLLFGDLGTLGRRVQWNGAVDHLDEFAAARERELVSHLLRHAPDRPASPQYAGAVEGSA